jgi:hypothetical protein
VFVGWVGWPTIFDGRRYKVTPRTNVMCANGPREGHGTNVFCNIGLGEGPRTNPFWYKFARFHFGDFLSPRPFYFYIKCSRFFWYKLAPPPVLKTVTGNVGTRSQLYFLVVFRVGT